MYHTILVPLDGSKRAEAILPHVEELARCVDATVLLLRVVEPSTGVQTLDGSRPSVRTMENARRTRESEDYLAAQQGEFREKGIRTQTYVTHGNVVEMITTIAERKGADLIAMSSHGRTGLARVFYGSVAAGVLHRVNRPLLIFRSNGYE